MSNAAATSNIIMPQWDIQRIFEAKYYIRITFRDNIICDSNILWLVKLCHRCHRLVVVAMVVCQCSFAHIFAHVCSQPAALLLIAPFRLDEQRVINTDCCRC